MKILPRFITILLYLFLQSADASEVTWELWKNNNAQSVSYRPVTIADKQLIEIKATARVSSNLSGFLSFIQEVNNTTSWLVNAKESKIINSYSPRETSFYVKLNKIWPLKDRILILKSTYWQNEDLSVDIVLKDASAATVEYMQAFRIIDLKRLLRVKIHSAHWKLIPKIRVSTNNQIDQTELFIEYIIIADGRGGTPKWLADHIALKSIWKSMRNIRHQLPEDKWQQQSIEGITELSVKPSID